MGSNNFNRGMKMVGWGELALTSKRLAHCSVRGLRGRNHRLAARHIHVLYSLAESTCQNGDSPIALLLRGIN